MSNNNEEARESIKDLLSEDNQLPVARPGDLPSFHTVEDYQYGESKSKAIAKAKKMMDSVAKLYLSQDVIEEYEYVRIKQKIEEMQLANLFNQMQQMEHSIETLMRTIDSGELSPRMFEVLGGLQKTMLEVMKHTTLHMMAAEENMKKIKHDIDIYGDSTVTTTKRKDDEDTLTARGNRDFMKSIQEEIQEVDFDENDSENEEV
jgi:hypothetical protein